MTEIKDTEVRGRGSTTLHFRGYKLAEISTERASSSRWVVMTVYAWPENGGLVLARTGESVTYHTSPSVCLSERTPVPASHLADDAEPCPQCRPGKVADLDPAALVVMEKPWYSFSLCTGLTELEDALLDLQPAAPGPSRRPSRVTAELLALVRAALGMPPAEPERPPLIRVTVGIPKDTLIQLTRAAAIGKTGVEQEILARLERSLVA